MPLRFRYGASLVVLLLGQISAAEPLPRTESLEMQGDLASQMVDGIDRFLLREIEKSADRRNDLWTRLKVSTEGSDAALMPARERLRRMIGVVDPRVSPVDLELISTTKQPPLVGRGRGFDVYMVRWPVVADVDAEGLLLQPNQVVIADCVAIPDADQSPEMLVGLVPGVPPEAQFARRLAENGVRVLVPLLMDRRDTYSVIPGRPPTNQPHREWIYRSAYEMGRHIIGYEVQKILAAVDFFEKDTGGSRSIGVYGYGEGGLLSLHAGALDSRIAVTVVSGYLHGREIVWQEPIYRNLFGQLEEFGDAELLGMIGRRRVIVETCRGPFISGPPAAEKGRTGGAAPGGLKPPDLKSIRDEVHRSEFLTTNRLRKYPWTNSNSPSPDPRGAVLPAHVLSSDGNGLPGSEAVVRQFVQSLDKERADLAAPGEPPTHLRKGFDPELRFRRQFSQLVEHTQRVMRESEYTRRAFWSKADRQSRSPEKWLQSAEWYRTYFRDEVIGRFDQPLLPSNARSRKIYDEPTYTGYEVVLDVFPDVFAYGILLLPKDIKPGERRPVVVCQHGLEGRPQDVADPKKENPAYHRFACRLAEKGFITYAPQNPYIFTDRFRTLQRKLNPLKKTLFSIIVPQHQQTVEWLATLPMVDPERIAFYGLSYGGKSAMRIPPLVPRYCLSICSADFNEWIWKNASTRSPYSYVTTGEYEIFEFDLGNTFNYAEMAGLIAPRPFMVERGHHDGVAPDEWVAYEYAKVRNLYAALKIPERTEIEFFDGPHTIHGVGTFAFLHKHLHFPQEKRAVP